MNLMESGEMYLETILQLQQRQGNVRSVDISEYMGYSKPSISRAVGLLKNGGPSEGLPFFVHLTFGLFSAIILPK